MNMYLCYHYVPLLLLLLCYPNFGRKFKFEMQNANAKGKCNRLSVKPFIATALFVVLLGGAPETGCNCISCKRSDTKIFMSNKEIFARPLHH